MGQMRSKSVPLTEEQRKALTVPLDSLGPYRNGTGTRPPKPPLKVNWASLLAKLITFSVVGTTVWSGFDLMVNPWPVENTPHFTLRLGVTTVAACLVMLIACAWLVAHWSRFENALKSASFYRE